jgi:hypothetical protein
MGGTQQQSCPADTTAAGHIPSTSQSETLSTAALAVMPLPSTTPTPASGLPMLEQYSLKQPRGQGTCHLSTWLDQHLQQKKHQLPAPRLHAGGASEVAHHPASNSRQHTQQKQHTSRPCYACSIAGWSTLFQLQGKEAHSCLQLNLSAWHPPRHTHGGKLSSQLNKMAALCTCMGVMLVRGPRPSPLADGSP